MEESQIDFDPDFDDYETIQDQWLDEGDDFRSPFRSSSNVNCDEIFDAVELDRGINPYGYQIITPYDYQSESDGSDTDESYIGDEHNSDIEHCQNIAKEIFSDFEDGLVTAELDDFFSPEGLLEFWQFRWIRLTEDQQKRFISRHEVELICMWPKIDVKKIMESQKKLSIVLERLNKGESIDAGDYKKYEPQNIDVKK